MKVAIIGAGNMGGALIKGWCKSGMLEDLSISARTQKTLDSFTYLYPSLRSSLSNCDTVSEADIVVLAVKPWLVDGIINEIRPVLGDKILVSVAANAQNERIDIYAMPNIAAEFGESMTFVEQPDRSQNDILHQVVILFEKVGQVMVVPHKQMAAGMMMAGCGIAYVMRMVRAMMEGGVEMGIYPKKAQQIAMQTMQGAVTLLRQTGLHPEVAIDKVTTPGGVTIKGLNELDHAGFNSAVIRCLKAGIN